MKRRRVNGNGTAARAPFRRPRPVGPFRPGGWRGAPIRRRVAEKNFIDTQIVHAPEITAGDITLLNHIGPGTGPNQRIGRKYVIKSIQLRMRVTQSAVADTANAFDIDHPSYGVRILVVWDKQPNGVAPAISDILQGTPHSVALTNLDNRNRFRIIIDKHFGTANQVSTAISTAVQLNSGCHMWKKYKKCNLTVINNANGNADIGDINTGALWFVSVSEASSTANPSELAGVFCRARLRYLDV